MYNAPWSVLLLTYSTGGTVAIYRHISIPYSFFFLEIYLIIHVSIQDVCLFSLYFSEPLVEKLEISTGGKITSSDWWSFNKWFIISFLISCHDWSSQTRHTYRHSYKLSFCFKWNSAFMQRKWPKMENHYIPFYKYFSAE